MGVMDYNKWFSCERKKKYGTIQEAKNKIKKRKKLYDNIDLSYYECDYCGCYHIYNRGKIPAFKQFS